MQPAEEFSTLVHEIAHLSGGVIYVALANGRARKSAHAQRRAPHNYMKHTKISHVKIKGSEQLRRVQRRRLDQWTGRQTERRRVQPAIRFGGMWIATK